jgi:hypothetical protein
MQYLQNPSLSHMTQNISSSQLDVAGVPVSPNNQQTTTSIPFRVGNLDNASNIGSVL